MTSQRASKNKEIRHSLTLLGREVPVVTKRFEQLKLKYYADNPRVYSIVRADGKDATQEEIYDRLISMDHTKYLIHDIKRNGGLLEPLLVRAGTLEVLEGNSRLTAYRFLFKKDPVKWSHVKCTFLSDDIDESVIYGFLGRLHIIGKKDWAPYEEAGFLYRGYTRHKKDVKSLAEEVGVSGRRVKHLIDTYQLMVDQGDRTVTRWSHYEEFVKSNKIRKARGQVPGFEAAVIKQIKAGAVKAVDIRDRLPVVCAASPEVIRDFVSSATGFEEAYERAVDEGVDNAAFGRLNKFRQWIARADAEKSIVVASGEARAKITFEINMISTRVQALKRKLGGKNQR